jgi:hypothetical protein
MERTSGFRNIRRVCGRLIVIGAMASTLAVAASAAAERTLAGIKIFSPMSLVLKKYGTPTEVRVGGQSTDTSSSTANGPFGGGQGGPGGLPGFGGGGPGGGYPGGPGGSGGYPGAGGRGPGGPGGPYGGNSEDDNGDGTGGYPGQSSTLGVTIQSNMVTWIYDLPDGGSLEFTFSSDGRVIQIHATGLKGNERTARGVALGMKLSEVMQMYGFPERQFISNRILHTSYIDKFHVAFQFYHQKLVGIIVAAVD